MEIEAWFLVDYNLFEKIHPIATLKTIKDRLNIDLAGDDPESYNHPSEAIKDIFRLFAEKYKKVFPVSLYTGITKDIFRLVQLKFLSRCFFQYNPQLFLETSIGILPCLRTKLKKPG